MTSRNRDGNSSSQSNFRTGSTHPHLKPVPATSEPDTSASPPKPKYKAEDFVVPAHDENGNSIPYSYRAGNRWAAMLEKIVWSRKFPYHTSADVQRHAMDRHMTWLDSIEPGMITADKALVDAINEATKQGDSMKAFAESIEKFEAVVRGLVKSNLRGAAVKLVHDNKQRARRFGNPLLRALYLSEIKSRFGALMTGEGATDLTATTDDDDEEVIETSWGFDGASGGGDGERELVIEESFGAEAEPEADEP